MSLHWPRNRINIGLGTFFGNELRVTFSPGSIELHLLKTDYLDGFKLKPAKHQIIVSDEESGGHISAQHLAQLTELLHDAEWRQAAAVAVFSNAFVRYVVLPWNAEISGKQERDSYLQHVFFQNFGELSKDWLLCEHVASYGSASIASSIHQELFKQVEAAFEAADLPLKAAHPLIMLAINQAIAYVRRNQLSHDFWLVCMENKRLTLALIQRGEWRLVRNVALEADNNEQLHIMLRRESLLAQIEGALPVLVYANHEIGLHEVAYRKRTLRAEIYDGVLLTKAKEAA